MKNHSGCVRYAWGVGLNGQFISFVASYLCDVDVHALPSLKIAGTFHHLVIQRK